ncbi:hypothetical protein Y88_0069 [Novosphingobium nitrogenifigens DSM 19370]|uniref:Uncharacterized protein n=1 Tax=Novosphingobium nitrogenifigens DSM 19370 TaxID=983920 RepID=F1Z4P2_9SPHN|nr:hypothetical protein [Novosphingobium nitrogenifigens]EGD60421.1 hypothetical protein Y88_0069 [Novosphingobium nitrogenifigens DSM 19370]
MPLIGSRRTLISRRPQQTYTSPSRYSFMGTGMRWPNTGSATTNVFHVTEWYFGTPDYPVTDPRVFATSFYSPTAGETLLAAGASITIQGWAIEVSSGTWVACDGASSSGLATIDNTVAGSLLPRIPTTLAANTVYRARIAFFVSSAGITIPRTTFDVLNAAGGPVRTQSSASTLFSYLSTSTTLNNTGLSYLPAYMIAKGGDGRPAFVAFGDSIGAGVNHSQVGAAWTARNAMGYIEVALDDKTTSKRLALFNSCVPGNRPCGPSGWDQQANWANKIAALQAAYAVQGAWPFDFIISQHITNAVPYTYDSGELRTGMGRYYTLLKSLFGKPITQIEGLPGTTTSNGFQTVAGETPASGKGYPTTSHGDMWFFNADVGIDGIPDPSTYYRTNGYIEDSVGAWRYASADLASNRPLWALRSFTTTLAAAAAQNATSVSMTAAPTVGATLYIQASDGTWSSIGRNVKTVSGSGPYTVTFDGTPISASVGAASGAVVQEAPSEGLHPSALLHRNVLVQSMIDWKTRRGWI